MKSLHLVSLGCAKNLVDSELMLGRLKKSGWVISPDPADAETIVVNTCSFVESAVDESIDTILELAKFKKAGACRQLIVAGCLPERYREEIVETLPEVDMFLGTGAYDKIIQAVEGSADLSACVLPDPNFLKLQKHDELRVQSSPFVSYLKIAEGCNRHCTYCIIPKLRGKQRSRPLEDIVAEARVLIKSGARELILVAQDTTAYGKDLNTSADLSGLLKRLSDISETVWIRFLYGHPESIDDTVIDIVSKRPNLCSYFDIPMQHVSSDILRQMGRKYIQTDLIRLIEKIRKNPEAAIRTTFIVGFPGEKDSDFKQLMDFVQDVRFDHLGVFMYSDSEDLPSHKLVEHVSDSVAQERYDALMTCQANISLENNRRHIGKTYPVLVEEEMENKIFSGRTLFQAPEVDGFTIIHSEHLQIGTVNSVKISDTTEYDLIGAITI